MYKILLDDNFYANTQGQHKYLSGLLDVIQKYFNAKIVYFTPFSFDARQKLHFMQMTQQINKMILHTQKVKKYDLDKVIPVSDDFLQKEYGFDECFIGKLSYLLEAEPDDTLIIPLVYSKEHRKLNCKDYNTRIYFIGNYNEEVRSNIVQWIQENEVIKNCSATYDD